MRRIDFKCCRNFNYRGWHSKEKLLLSGPEYKYISVYTSNDEMSLFVRCMNSN